MRPKLPAVKDRAWVRNPVDHFILAQLEANGLKPAAEADRRTLARRLSLDLDEHYSNVTVSDIPGPPGPLYCAGGSIDELWPLATLMPRHAARVVVISYAGTLFFGITVDPAVIGDSRPIAEGIERAASELCAPVA